MATLDYFVGQDSNGNPQFQDVSVHGDDARGNVREDSAANQYDWNKMVWQSDYNSATSQISRLQEAGLNPLFYSSNVGNQGAGSGGSGSTSSLTSATGSTGQLLEAGKNASDALLQTQLQAQQYDIARRELNIKDRQTAIQESMLPYNQSNVSADTNLKNSQSRLNTKTIDKINGEIDLMVKQGNLTDEQAIQAKANTAVLTKQLDVMSATIQNVNADTQFKYSQKVATDVHAACEQTLTGAQYDDLMESVNLKRQQFVGYAEQIAGFQLDNKQKALNLKIGAVELEGKKLENGTIEWNLNFAKEHQETSLYLERGLAITAGVCEVANTTCGVISTAYGIPVQRATAAELNARRRMFDNTADEGALRNFGAGNYTTSGYNYNSSATPFNNPGTYSFGQ